jgi:3-phosphoshikimate 1-carboxyvinyltransferase
MYLKVQKTSKLQGCVEIPASKSHTIRALILATLAKGSSEILNPLTSADATACRKACEAFGAKIQMETGRWVVEGTGGLLQTPEDVVNVENSGTTLFLVTGMACHGRQYAVFTGDHQTRRRSAGSLLEALRNLGAEAFSTRGNGCAPLVVRGPLKGGRTEVAGKTSQYLSSLLLSTPLAEKDSEIRPIDLQEKPYVGMTLWWLNKQKILHEREGLEYFKIKGGQAYQAFQQRIPGDFSSAAFPLCAAAITESDVLLKGLDIEDSQGDKKVISYLQEMSVCIQVLEDGIRVRGGTLKGAELDLNDTPDALPIMSVVGCFAQGTTRLRNVAHARIKETDRITTMCRELSKLGAQVEELPDGLVIHESPLQGCLVDGHGDHRVVMSLAIAGLKAEGMTEIMTAEAVSVTYPDFVDSLKALGANMQLGSPDSGLRTPDDH